MKINLELPTAVHVVINVLSHANNNAKFFLVGGAVRDFILHKPMKDWDIEVFGIEMPEILLALKKANIEASAVGLDFGIIKANVSGVEIDLAIPRIETKIGNKRQDFEIKTDSSLDTATASARRDFTINAMMLNLVTGELLDHHGGLQDLSNNLLRHTSAAFSEDPLRVLRAFQFVSRFGLTVAPETVALCKSLKTELIAISQSRFIAELRKFAKGNEHKKALQFLEQVHMLDLFGLGNCNIDCIELAELPLQDCDEDERLAMIFATLLFVNGKLRVPTQLTRCVSDVSAKACQQLLDGLNKVDLQKSPKANASWLLHLASKWDVALLQKLAVFIFGKEADSIQQAMPQLNVKPLIAANHLPLKGKEIGIALKKLHHAQLDGQFDTLEQGLELLPSL